MKVFKFGGASVNSIERIKTTGEIMHSVKGEKILVVISAMGKTTNALEKVVDAFYNGNNDLALNLFETIKQDHLDTVKYLLSGNWKKASAQLTDFFTEVEWLLHDKAVRDYDYYYDQVVSIGELMSTAIMSAYFEEENISNSWIDVRDIFRTDNAFRDASIDWEITAANATEKVLPLFEKVDIVITQGFIGATDQNESTTLGREGSDYSAAIFANLLDASSLTIWKDVKGVMNADPKAFPTAVYLPALSFDEVIEMAYYGAQVIHPKTIKPLQNKNIPLHVRCFLDSTAPGTVISKKHAMHLPPIIVLKENQVLMQLISRDFSFIGEKPVSRLYELFAAIKIKPNLTQNAAISMLCCFDDQEEKISRLAEQASEIFDVQILKGLTLLTIRHYTPEIIIEYTEGKNILLEQKTKETLQVLMNN